MEGGRILARPSLQARGRLPALCAAAESSERPPPAGLAHSSLCSTPDRWGRFPVWLCSGPRMHAWHRPAAWLSGRRTELKGRAEHRVPFPGSPFGEKPQRQAGLSGPDPDGATLVRAPGIPPVWDTQLGQLPSLPQEGGSGRHGTSLPAGHRTLAPLGNFISLDDIFARCGRPWGPDSIT